MNNPLNTYITGHSLGGGLASAASIVSGFHGYTFNAAGLHKDTVAGMNIGSASYLIDSFYVDYDILTWAQTPSFGMWLVGFTIPPALGTSHELDSEYDAEMVAARGGVMGVLIGAETPATLAIRFWCHLNAQVIYGIEQRVFAQ